VTNSELDEDDLQEEVVLVKESKAEDVAADV
jgi:hypothetical protein